MKHEYHLCVASAVLALIFPWVDFKGDQKDYGKGYHVSLGLIQKCGSRKSTAINEMIFPFSSDFVPPHMCNNQNQLRYHDSENCRRYSSE